MSVEATLRRYVDTYVEAIAGVPYRAIDQLQPAPFASLAFGGAGTAYVLGRLGQVRRAGTWLDACLADRRRAAYAVEAEPVPRASFLHGRGGVLWARAWVGGRARDRAVAGFVRAGAADAQPLEHAEGLAGQLTGARLLLARFEHAALRRHAGRLAARLGAALEARARAPWQPIDTAGFAHHWPGIVHALLAWLQHAGEPVPGWLATAVRRMLASWQPEVARIPELAASWCNGATGAVLLWAKAYELLGDRELLEAARRAAERALAVERIGADLCCGLAGVGYAALALDRLEPRAGWRGRAGEAAARAIARPALRWPNGLYKGHPGLVCLALDLLADRPGGFPGIDA